MFLPPLIAEKEGMMPSERRSTDLATYGSRDMEATATTCIDERFSEDIIWLYARPAYIVSLCEVCDKLIGT